MPLTALSDLKALLPRGKRLMGVDHSKNAWGLAVSTPELTLATPLTVLATTRFGQDVQKLASFCAEYAVGGFVIGLPLNMDDSEGPRAQSVRHFADNLIAHAPALGFDPLIAFYDERLSSAAVEDILNDHRVPPARRAAARDKLAAQLILQGALDALAKVVTPPVSSRR